MGDDHAGPLAGWSLATGMQQRRIHELVQFPCVFRFKAIGRATTGFVTSLLQRVGAVLGRSVREDEHSVRASAHGAYESLTLDLWVTSGDEVYSIYAALKGDERVKFLL
ncbi:MAG: DUF493 domain-containing protein [Deltaproteobacteria bacterium]|jgi:putative lipoic acid-binding regulatory protein|nr:DUF493 domain-containing protein [Deltaproteobacteria bacterium]